MELITFGNYYHVFNRGINGCLLFKNHENFRYFLKLFNKYIHPIAETFAWCLIHNHFHFLVRIKTEKEISGKIKNPKRYVSQQFSNFFNAYSKAYNKKYRRHGALFERPFKRVLVKDDIYFKKLIVYIHTNPVHHGLVSNPVNYSWTSYQFILKNKHNCIVNKLEVIKLFDDLENFIFVHQLRINSLDFRV